MADNRTPRELDTRLQGMRVEQWMPPSLLPDPNPEPGYVFRWIRIATLGTSDPTNVSAKMREGWVPVKASDHPELGLPGMGNDNVEVGGLVLCKTPEKLVSQRDAYYGRQAKSQMESVDNTFLRESDPRMPLFSEKRSEVKFGKGSK